MGNNFGQQRCYVTCALILCVFVVYNMPYLKYCISSFLGGGGGGGEEAISRRVCIFFTLV